VKTGAVHHGLRALRSSALALGTCAAVSCASGGDFTTGEPAPLIARRVVEATAPARPLRIVFDWSLRDRDARFSGAGAARVQAVYRGRLDLFGPRGETYLRAALVGEQMSLPASAPADALPPPALLWAALGVLQPPADAELVGTSTNAGATFLEYRRGQERWRFRVQDDKLRYAEWLSGADGRRTVDLEGDGGFGLPQRALYRDWIAFRELELILTEIDEVDAFPDDIFFIPR
jgi:hypothetical protein